MAQYVYVWSPHPEELVLCLLQSLRSCFRWLVLRIVIPLLVDRLLPWGILVNHMASYAKTAVDRFMYIYIMFPRPDHLLNWSRSWKVVPSFLKQLECFDTHHCNRFIFKHFPKNDQPWRTLRIKKLLQKFGYSSVPCTLLVIGEISLRECTSSADLLCPRKTLPWFEKQV